MEKRVADMKDDKCVFTGAPHEGGAHVRHDAHKTEHHAHASAMPSGKKVDMDMVNVVLVGLLLLSVVVGASLVWSTSSKSVVASPPALPKVSVLLIDPACKECVSLANAASGLRSVLDVTEEKTVAASSDEAQEAIERYNISRLPAVVLKGELDAVAKLNPAGFERVDDALVSREVPAPFIDAESGLLEGRVTATVLSAALCTKCQNVSLVVDQLKQGGVFVGDVVRVDVSSPEGQALVAKYSLKRVPTVIFSEDAKWYPQIVQPFASVGSVEADGVYVWREVSAPYLDVLTGKVRGLLDVVYLNDSSCKTCYDVLTHRGILQGSFGASLEKESFIDVSSAEGKRLIADFSVTKVPTVLVRGDVDAYPGLVAAWTEVGRVVNGTFVFDNVGLLGQPYRDVVNGTIVTPTG